MDPRPSGPSIVRSGRQDYPAGKMDEIESRGLTVMVGPAKAAY